MSAASVTGAGFQPMPALTGEEYAALKADIAERGIVVPVVVDQHGRLLDGHHRRSIAEELDIDCPTEVRHVDDDDQAHEIALALKHRPPAPDPRLGEGQPGRPPETLPDGNIKTLPDGNISLTSNQRKRRHAAPAVERIRRLRGQRDRGTVAARSPKGPGGVYRLRLLDALTWPEAWNDFDPETAAFAEARIAEEYPEAVRS